MNFALASFRFKNQLSSFVAPSWTAKKALKLFLTPNSPAIKPWENVAEEKGRRFKLSNHISAIEWGEVMAQKRILLVHGWESRATQLYGLVPSLLNLGYKVVAVDMPAHGHSQGTMSNAKEFVETILLAQQRLGKFDVVIGHSMGAGASGMAMAKGLDTQKLVLISGPSSIENVLRRFTGFIGLNARTSDLFVRFVEKHVGGAVDTLDSARLLDQCQVPALLIHDQEDLEIPISESKRLLGAFKMATLFETSGQGHRKILKYEGTINKITEFLSN